MAHSMVLTQGTNSHPPMRFHPETSKVTIATQSKFPFLEEDVDHKCKTLGYAVPKQGGTVLIATRDGSQSLGQVWSKDDFSITYDPSRGFLSVEGKDPSELGDESQVLVKMAEELLGDVFDDEVRWMELNFAARSSSDRRPLEAIGATPSSLHKGLGEVFDEPLLPFGISAYAGEKEELNRPLNEVTNWFDLRIEPLIANPRYYFIRIVYRNRKPDQVIKFVRELLPRLESAIRLLEKS